MKKVSSFVLALVVALLMVTGTAQAQTWNNTNPGDWQSANWGIPTYWPGINPDNSAAIINPIAGLTLNNAVPANAIGNLTISASAFNVLFNGTGTLIINGDLDVNSPLTIGVGMTVRVRGALKGSQPISLRNGATLILESTATTAVQGTVTIIGAASSVVNLGAGFNGGVLSNTIFSGSTLTSGLVINSNIALSGNLTSLPTSGSVTLNGNFSVNALSTLTLRQTATNSLQGTGQLAALPGGTIALGNSPGGLPFNGGVIAGANYANPFTGTLSIATGTNATLSGTMNIGANGVINVVGGSAVRSLTISAGSTLRISNTLPNAVQQSGTPPGVIAIAAGGVLEYAAGANAGQLNFAVVTDANGTVRTLGPMVLTMPGAGQTITPFPIAPTNATFTGSLDLGGDLTLSGAGRLRMTSLASNALTGTGKIIAPGVTTELAVDPGFNNGILKGGNFACPFNGEFIVATGGTFDIQNTLCLGGPVTLGGLLNITPGAELRLSFTGTPATRGLFGSTGGIVAVNSTSVLRLSSGYSGGVLPFGTQAFIQTSTTGTTGFKGRLIVESNQILARSLTFEPGSILDLSPGSLTVSNANAIVTQVFLNNQSASSLTGTGFLQATGGTNTLAPQVVLGPTFNNGSLLTNRFANPFLGTLNVTNANALSLQGTLVMGVTGITSGSLILGATQLTINSGSRLTLNSISVNAILTSATLPGLIQGLNCNSVLELGPGFSGGQINATNGSTGFLANPFNGNLTIQGRGLATRPMQITNGTITIGPSGCLTLNDDISVSLNSTLTLNNQGANSLSGVGRIGGYFGNDMLNLPVISGAVGLPRSQIVLGTGFNNGAINANNLLSPLTADLSLPISPLTLTGFLTFATTGATLKTQAPGQLTLAASSSLSFTTSANAWWGTGKIQGSDLTSQITFGNGKGFNSGWSGIQGDAGGLNPAYPTGINAQHFVSPFIGTINIAPPPTNTNRPVFVTNGTLTFAPTSILNLLGPVVVTGGSSVVLGMTGSNSILGSTLGTIQGTSNSVVIELGPGFNANQIPGNRFGTTTSPFIGTLKLPSSGNMTLTASLTTATVGAATNTGLIDLAGTNLTIADAVVLTLSASTSNTVSPLTATTGRIQGATNTSEIIFPLPSAAAGFAANPAITTATFASPFNGRLSIGTTNPFNTALPISPARITYSIPTGILTIGASGSANGVLNLATSTTLLVQNGATLVLNNVSATGASLPGGGNISGAGPTANITLGPGALGATIPGSVFDNPFIGNLVTSAGPLMTLTQPGMVFGTGLADDASFTANGNVAIGANATMTFNNQTASRLITNGGVISAADPTTSRFVFGNLANGAVVPGSLFSDPFTGTVVTSSAMNLSGRLTMGQVNNFNGVLNLGGILTVPNAAPVGANLVLNNRNPDFIALPGLQTISVAGVAGGGDLLNGRLTIGPGALSTTANVAIIPNNRLTNNSMTGTLATSTGTAVITSGTLILANAGGSIRVAGNTGNTAIPFSTSNQVLLGASAGLNISNTDVGAIGGNGVIQGTGTRSQVYFGAAANGSTIPGNSFGQHFLGQMYTNSAMNLSGDLRLAPAYSFAPATGASIQLGGTLTTLAGARLSVWNTLAAPGNAFPVIPAAGALGGTNGGNVAVPNTITPATVVLGPGFASGVIDQTPASPLLTPVFNGMLITSTGTTTINSGPLTLGTLDGANVNSTTGTLEIGGPLAVGANVALRFNNTAYQSSTGLFTHSVTAGATGTVNATAAASVITLTSGFNGSYFSNPFFGATQTITPNCGVASSFQVIGNGVGNGQLNILGPTALAIIPASANLRVNGTLQFGNVAGATAAGRLVISTSGTLSVAQTNNFDAANPGSIVAGSATSVFDLPSAVTINNLFPTLGVAGTGFTGRVRVNGVSTISAVAVTIAPTGTLELCSNAFLSLANLAGSTLNLNNTGTNSLTGTGLILATAATTGVVNFGAGFNASSLPGTYFGSSANPFLGTMRIASSLSVTSSLFVGTAGLFDFTAGSSNKLTLTQPASILGTVSNSGSTRYFVTAPSALTLGNVGNTTFPVGPTTAVFAPINITNNATPASFSVVAAGAVTQTPPFATGSAVLRQAIVNQQWNVTQVTGVTAGFAVTIAPLWLATQENSGFNRALSVANAFTTTSGTISSGVGAASSDPTFTGYFRSAVTVTQTATNNLNNTPILVTSQPSPAVLAFTPPAQSSGATLTITGNRFAPGAAVSLGGVNVPAANVTLVSGGSSGIDTLRVVVPSNAASGNVIVTQAGGTSTAANQFTFLGTPLQQAVIYTVVPSPIPAGLGDVEVTINGAAFGVLTPRVVAAGSGITSTLTPSSNTTTKIVVTVPGQVVRNVGSVVFTVTSLDRLPVSTTVTVSTPPALVLTSLAPASTTGNLRVFTLKVNGNNFSAQSVFTLGASTLRVLSITRNADGTLTANLEAPVGVLSGNVNVLNLNGQTASLPFVVNNLPRPLVTSVSPNVLPPGSPNATITINGRYFIPGASVFFNGQPLTGVQLTGDSLITVTVPAALLANPDLAVLTVTNPDGQSIGYRLPITVAAPGAIEIRSFTPATTTASASAFSILIDGSGFAGTPRVFLGGVQLTVVGATSATQLRVNVPASANVAGTYQLQVINPSGVMAQRSYTIQVNTSGLNPQTAPGISRVTPAQANAGIAGNITIEGVNLVAGSIVRLGTTQLVIVSLAADGTRIVATIPGTVAAGTYVLSVTVPDGRRAEQPFGVVVSVSNDPLAGIRVYPNPVAEMVSVEANLERAAKVVITVTNSLGQRVMVVEQNAAAGFFSRSLNINTLPSGAYMVEITDGTRRSVEKIIKN